MISVFLFIAAAIFIGIGFGLKKFAESSEGEWHNTTGIVMACNTEDHSSYVTPIIRFADQGQEVLASAAAVRSKGCPSEGSEVAIEYKRNLLSGGRTTYQVIMQTGRKTDEEGNLPPKIMMGIGALLGVAGIILLFV